jgi:hypothetical protein
MQGTRFLQQRDGESGPLGCYSGLKSQLLPASIFFDYLYSQDRGNVFLRNVRNYQSAWSHLRSLKSSYFKGAGVAKYTIYKNTIQEIRQARAMP